MDAREHHLLLSLLGSYFKVIKFKPVFSKAAIFLPKQT
jgi:hypothetical protein